MNEDFFAGLDVSRRLQPEVVAGYFAVGLFQTLGLEQKVRVRRIVQNTPEDKYDRL